MITDLSRKSAEVSVQKITANSGRRIKINISKRIGFNDKQTKQHISALDLAEKVINSKEFKDKVITIKSFTSSNQNGKQVYDKLMTGEETLQPGVDYEFDMEVTMYESNNSTVGYTYGNKVMVWINNKFFKSYSLGDIAGNFFHEYLHKLGYGHTSYNTNQRPNSVPYKLGYLMGNMVDGYIAGTQPLTDLYPEDGAIVIGGNPDSAPLPPIEVIKKKVCGFTWRFWLGRVCWYE